MIVDLVIDFPANITIRITINLHSSTGGKAMAEFLVAHGAWSAGWAWKKMHPLMREVGHDLLVQVTEVAVTGVAVPVARRQLPGRLPPGVHGLVPGQPASSVQGLRC